MTDRTRSVNLDPASLRLLDDWGAAVRSSFPSSFGPFHVGSSFRGGDGTWRDVDVRVILNDADYNALAAVMKPKRLNLMLTLCGRQVTGLPIDCQVQAQSWANERYPHPRSALGLRDDNGDEGA